MTAIKSALIPYVDRRKFGRVRWIRKAREVREYGAPVHRHLRYVLTDPELDNYTYELGNAAEIGAWLDQTFATGAGSALLGEAGADVALRRRVDAAAARRRWSMKQRPGLGRRLGWYAIVRLLKPRRIVETGTHDGLGSLVLLAALERNAAEGSEGRARLARPRSPHGLDGRRRSALRPGHRPDARDAAGRARRAGRSAAPRQRSQLRERALRACRRGGGRSPGPDPRITAGSRTALADVCAEHGGRYSFVPEVPRDHFFPGCGIGVGLFGDAAGSASRAPAGEG